MLCNDNKPAVAVGYAGDRKIAITAFAATAIRTDPPAIALYLIGHSWSAKPPHMPALPLPPKSWASLKAQCFKNRLLLSGAVCCRAQLLEPPSPGRHVVANVSLCNGQSTSTLERVDLTIGIRGGTRGSLDLTLAADVCTRGARSRDAAMTAAVCLGPVFSSPVHPQLQRLVWRRWLEHNRQNGIGRIFAYGLDDGALSAFSSEPDVIYSDWPRQWHRAVDLPLMGNASQTSRLTVSTFYTLQPLVLQKCFVEHGLSGEAEWLLSMDTDEFVRGEQPLLDLLSTHRQEADGVVRLCRGQVGMRLPWAGGNSRACRNAPLPRAGRNARIRTEPKLDAASALTWSSSHAPQLALVSMPSASPSFA